jgi:hypothetical protein
MRYNRKVTGRVHMKLKVSDVGARAHACFMCVHLSLCVHVKCMCNIMTTSLAECIWNQRLHMYVGMCVCVVCVHLSLCVHVTYVQYNENVNGGVHI